MQLSETTSVWRQPVNYSGEKRGKSRAPQLIVCDGGTSPAHFLKLQSRQSSSTFSATPEPPFDCGMMWSNCRLESDPQFLHRPPSRFHTKSLVSAEIGAEYTGFFLTKLKPLRRAGTCRSRSGG